MKPRFANRNELRARLILLGLAIDFIVCAWWARPLLPFLLGGAVLWLLAENRQGAFAKTARDLLPPLFVGLTLVCAGLIGLNEFDSHADQATVNSVELRMSHWRLAVNGWTDLSLERLLILATLLLALAVRFTQLKPVIRFKQAQAVVGSFQTVLLVLASISIYAQVPLQRNLDHTDARIASHYRAALKRELDAKAVAVAAQTIEHRVQKMKPRERRQLGLLFRSVDRAARADRVSVHSIDAYMFESAPSESAGAAVAKLQSLIDPPPTSGRQLDAEANAVPSQAAMATRSEQKTAQIVDLASITVSSLLSLSLPIQSEWVHTIIDDWIGNLADRLEPRVAKLFTSVVRFAQRHGKLLDSAEPSTKAIAEVEPKTLDQLKTLSWPRGSIKTIASLPLALFAARGVRNAGDAGLSSEMQRLLDESTRGVEVAGR
jgi:hypothetical protein